MENTLYQLVFNDYIPVYGDEDNSCRCSCCGMVISNNKGNLLDHMKNCDYYVKKIEELSNEIVKITFNFDTQGDIGFVNVDNFFNKHRTKYTFEKNVSLLNLSDELSSLEIEIRRRVDCYSEREEIQNLYEELKAFSFDRSPLGRKSFYPIKKYLDSKELKHCSFSYINSNYFTITLDLSSENRDEDFSNIKNESNPIDKEILDLFKSLKVLTKGSLRIGQIFENIRSERGDLFHVSLKDILISMKKMEEGLIPLKKFNSTEILERVKNDPLCKR